MNTRIALALAACTLVLPALAQTPAQTPAQAPAAPPLKLQSLEQETKADPFPPSNPKNFTAATPTIATVDTFLHALWGYDANRIWRVAAIETTEAPGISKVVVLVSDRSPNAPVQSAVFFITPDGNHALAGTQIISFGIKPFADFRAKLAKSADGPAKGAVSKDLLLVEFSDLQCPHCKDAQSTMKNLEQDYPRARIVYQPFPLIEIHPYAFTAAAYGLCIAQNSNDAYFPYAQAVYDTQASLTPESAEATLKAAVTKAGQDPTAIATCAEAPATKAHVNASIELGKSVGVDQTPMLAVNGRVLPLGSLSYEVLKRIIDYTIEQDGIVGTAPAALQR